MAALDDGSADADHPDPTGTAVAAPPPPVHPTCAIFSSRSDDLPRNSVLVTAASSRRSAPCTGCGPVGRNFRSRSLYGAFPHPQRRHQGDCHSPSSLCLPPQPHHLPPPSRRSPPAASSPPAVTPPPPLTSRYLVKRNSSASHPVTPSQTKTLRARSGQLSNESFILPQGARASPLVVPPGTGLSWQLLSDALEGDASRPLQSQGTSWPNLVSRAEALLSFQTPPS